MLAVDTVRDLARVDNIVGVKDSSGDLGLTGEYIRTTRPWIRGARLTRHVDLRHAVLRRKWSHRRDRWRHSLNKLVR